MEIDVRERISYAARGRILDRNGKVLADNTLSFQLTATPYLMEEGATREADIKRMSELIGVKVKNPA